MQNILTNPLYGISHLKIPNQNSYWGQHSVSDLLFDSTSTILNSGEKTVGFWEDFPALESCEEPALCAGTAGATQARGAALINPGDKFL